MLGKNPWLEKLKSELGVEESEVKPVWKESKALVEKKTGKNYDDFGIEEYEKTFNIVKNSILKKAEAVSVKSFIGSGLSADKFIETVVSGSFPALDKTVVYDKDDEDEDLGEEDDDEDDNTEDELEETSCNIPRKRDEEETETPEDDTEDDLEEETSDEYFIPEDYTEAELTENFGKSMDEIIDQRICEDKKRGVI